MTHKDAPDERERPRTRSPHRDRTLKAAEKYVARGKVDKALVEYDKWVVANPDDWTTIRRMGDLYARIGRKEEAVKMYARVAEQFREGGFRVRAISTEKVILRLDPENARAQQSLAEMLVIQGLGLEAAHQYERLVDLYTKQGQREKADAARRALQKLRSNAPD